MARIGVLLLAAALSSACAGLTQLSQLIRPPQFAQADDRPTEIRFVAPSATLPAGGAGVRLWLEVANPNPFGITLTTVSATLSLEGSHAATGDFPLGLPLTAQKESLVPLDLSISFADLPGLAGALRRIAVGADVPFTLDGTVGIDAGRFGSPTFGPMRLTQGNMRLVR